MSAVEGRLAVPSRGRDLSVWPLFRDRPPSIGCASVRGACCASNKLANLLAKGRSFKRRDPSTIHPQPGRLVRADHIFRGAPFFSSLLRHGAKPHCPCYFLTP